MMEEKNIWEERRQNILAPPVGRDPMYINIYIKIEGQLLINKVRENKVSYNKMIQLG